MEERERSVESAVSSTEFYGSDKKPETPREPQDDSAISKRKAEDLQSASSKRQRLDQALASAPTMKFSPCAGLSPEVWQHVFLSCSVTTLGRLLQVNRSFHSYLTDVQLLSDHRFKLGRLRLIKSDSIWSSARQAHPTKPPKPLPGFSELQMWRLALGKSCQFCHKTLLHLGAEKPWQKGPGIDGVRTIWPFGIRSCGECLTVRCEKESTLLFSSASALLPALPFAFITSDQNVIPAYSLQEINLPPNVEVRKYYNKGDIERITQELKEAQNLGPAAAEEWSKGLDSRGKERMKSSENWERWEVKYQWWLNHQDLKRAHASSVSLPSPSDRQEPNSPFRQQTLTPSMRTNPSTPFQPPPVTRSIVMPQPVYPQPHTYQSHPHQPPIQASVQYHIQHSVQAHTQHFRPERNIHDANEAKAARKADIENRCQSLNPPIPPNVLRHMESFKAALQISQPMTDQAWQVLKPRLLAQLPAAEQAENENTSRVASFQIRVADRRQQDAGLKEMKEVMDREWEESQKPVRDQLGSFADDFVNQQWPGDQAINYDNSPRFAADMLIHVRRRFYTEIYREEEAAPSQETNNDDTSHMGKLVLENMKWVYDNKIKPLTEQFRKELFLCNDPGCQGNTRFYGFEGVIQHFGAKHTNAFSVGNIVVSWREAEWPELPPFVPDPIGAKSAYPTSSSMPSYGHSGQSAYSTYQYGGYSRGGTSTPHMPTHLPQTSPGPNYHYGGNFQGPYPPPNATPGYNYDYPHPYAPPPVESYPAYQPRMPSSYLISPAMSHSAALPASTSAQRFQGPYHPDLYTSPRQVASNPAMANSDTLEPSTGYRTSLYDAQVSSLIRLAQEGWKKTSGIKDFPNSVRIYVVVHSLLSKFHLEFNHEPTLDHFIDALSNHSIPKALKHATGLSCNACHMKYFHSSSHLSRAEDRRTFTVLALFSHFRSDHLGKPGLGAARSNGIPGPSLDWREDMIELPNERFISGLIHAPGMDDDKLHMIATVFPRAFPLPLPRLGTVDSNGIPSASRSGSKDPKDPGGRTPISTLASGLLSHASPRVNSPRDVTMKADEEYDPQHPGLLRDHERTGRPLKRLSLHGTPPPEARRAPSYGEPRYYLARDPMDEEYMDRPPRGFVELNPANPRTIRDNGLVYRDPQGRRVYRDRASNGLVLADPREFSDEQVRKNDPYYEELRYSDDAQQPGPRSLRNREPRMRSPGLSSSRAEADRFLDEFGEHYASKAAAQGLGKNGPDVAAGGEADPDDGSRYTPPPPEVAGTSEDRCYSSRSGNAHLAPTLPITSRSNYEESGSIGRHSSMADSGAPAWRDAPSRRRERYYDHVPARYYRYMTVAREEPYGRPSSQSMSRSNSRFERKHDRYAQQRRRLDEQETPQPQMELEVDRGYSRDRSVDQGYLEDPYYHQLRHDYVPVEEDAPPIRYRYHDDRTTAPQATFVDEYGQQFVRVYSQPRLHRDPYISHQPSQYVPDQESDHIQYVPIRYDRLAAQSRGGARHDDRPSPYVYYEGEDMSRRPTFEPEAVPLEVEVRPESQVPLMPEAEPPA